MKFISRSSAFLKNLNNPFFYQVLIVFVLSLAVRLLYVNLNSPFVFHPDEPTIVNSTINLRYNLNPKHFDWPTLTYYLNYPIYDFFERLDSKLIRDFKVDLDLINFFNYYLITRVLTAILGSLAVVFLFLSLLNLGFSKNISLISTCMFSLMPFFLFRSSQALPDVPMLFFGVLMIYFISKHYVSKKFYFLILASFALGLSVSSKYTGYLFGISLLGYLFHLYRFSFQTLKKLIIVALFVMFGFLVGTPYAILDSKTFLISDSPKGALWQFQNVGKSDLPSQIWYFFNNLFFFELNNFGYLPQIVVLLLIGTLLYEKIWLKKTQYNFVIPQTLFLVFLVQYIYIFWTVSGISSGSQRAQHFLPVFPFAVILASVFFQRIDFHKVKLLFVVFVFVNILTYLSRLEPEPIVKFYYKLDNSSYSIKKDETVYYNQSDMVPVLEKIGYDLEKFDERKGIPDDALKIFSGENLCLNLEMCNLRVIYLEKNVFSNKSMYLYIKK